MIVDVNTSVRILEKISLTIIVGIAAYLAYLAAYIFAIVFGGLFTIIHVGACLLYTSPSPRDQRGSRMPSSA